MYENICLYWASGLNSLHTVKEDGTGKVCSKKLDFPLAKLREDLSGKHVLLIYSLWLSNERYVHYLSIQLIVNGGLEHFRQMHKFFQRFIFPDIFLRKCKLQTANGQKLPNFHNMKRDGIARSQISVSDTSIAL